jgi:hypothetical protein
MSIIRQHAMWQWTAVVLLFGAALVEGAWAASPRSPVHSKAGLLAALRSAGLSATSVGKVQQPFFSVPGQGFKINNQPLDTIQVFEYPSVTAAARDAAKIHPDGTVAGMAINWIAQPHFYRAERVIIIYPGTNAKLLAALQAAVGKPFAVGPRRR